MGRKERHDVDYFPFIVKDGKTLFILEGKYQCKGTGFFTNLFRFLSRTPDHHYQLLTESDRLFFFTTTRCDPESALDMIEIMVATGKLDEDLWRKKSILASLDYLDSIQDAYRKRSNPCITLEEIKAKYSITSTGNTQVSVKPAEETPQDRQSSVLSTGINPYSKGKESKGKDIIPKTKYLDAVLLTDEEHKKLIEKYGKQSTLKAIEVLNNAIMSKGYKYKSHYHTIIGWPMREVGGSKGTVAPKMRVLKPSDVPDDPDVEAAEILKRRIENKTT